MTWLNMNQVDISLAQKSIIKQFNISLKKGEIACLLGASGCGKTTILRAIAGFEDIAAGDIALNQKVLAQKGKCLPAHEREVGMVFQDYALFGHLNIQENIAFGLSKYKKSARQERVKTLLSLIGLSEYAKAYPHQLSGGQQQRVALARALAPKPKLILLDEPFSNLDTELRLQLAKDIRYLLQQENMTAILVTHDQEEAFAFADTIGLVADGQLQQWGKPETLFYQPVNAAVANFFGQGSWLKTQVLDETRLQTALGVYKHPVTHGLPVGDVNLLVRAHEVVLVDEAGALAQVNNSVYQGWQVQHALELTNGEILLANWPKQQQGSVNIALKLDHVIAFE